MRQIYNAGVLRLPAGRFVKRVAIIYTPRPGRGLMSSHQLQIENHILLIPQINHGKFCNNKAESYFTRAPYCFIKRETITHNDY